MMREAIRRILDMLKYRKRFGRLHQDATYPRIEEDCGFQYPAKIKVGSDVRFLKGAVVLADPAGEIRIGSGSAVCRYAVVQSAGGTISIGNDTTVGDFCNLYGQGGVTIGDNVMIAAGVRIVPNQHTFDDPHLPINKQPCRAAGIKVGDGAWVGVNACILDGVCIGKGAVIGAGSVVTRDVPDFAIAVGVPAKILRYRPGYGVGG